MRAWYVVYELTLYKRQVRHKRHIVVEGRSLDIIDRVLKGLVQRQGLVLMAKSGSVGSSRRYCTTVITSSIRVRESMWQLGLQMFSRLIKR